MSSQTDLMVTGWAFLGLAGSIFVASVAIIRGVMALLDRRTHRGDTVSEEWLAGHRRIQKPPDRAA